MSEDDYEIEFLDEDADLVEQCVLKVMSPQISVPGTPTPVEEVDKKRKLRDFEPPAPASKKKKVTTKQSNVKPKTSGLNNSLTQKDKQPPNVQETVQVPVRRSLISQKRDLAQRKLLNIKIPDFDDPLCLPVVALRHTDNDAFRLQNWNQVCLNGYKECEKTLTGIDNKPAVSSSREMTFQCALNKYTGRMETTVKNKLVTKNRDGFEKPYLVEILLPVYREKVTLRNFNLQTKKERSQEKYEEEVLLNKEVLKNEHSLVVYKPHEKVAAVYEFLKNDKELAEEDVAPKRCMKETTICKICSSCYQTSWRGSRVVDKKNLKCCICLRSCVSVYSLLAHLKTHDNAEIKMAKKKISQLLASVVDYHYKCRICRVTCSSIKNLRKHAVKHKGIEQFYCEVGQHTTY